MDFNAKFNKATVLDFLKNQFLPDDYAESHQVIKISDLSFTPEKIKGIEFVGESAILGLRVYLVHHSSESDPRVTLSREIFRVMSSLGAQRALVVFYSASAENYRLSLATITLALKGAKTKREYSNPRRYSFFLGPEARIHTPREFLETKGQIKDFDDLLKRFSIEVVNKEFYNEIAVKFTELVGGKRKVGARIEEYKPVLRLPDLDMSKPEAHRIAQEFAVRLIGRIVFCWFLKKKKSSTGEPLLPETVLSYDVVEACDKAKNNYYHAILENLFFQVLNTETSERVKEFTKAPYNKIPFLNGGLFEPQDPYDFYRFDPVTVFSKSINTLVIPNSWFKGLLEILETYNFTIDENTSVDVELAVDPEMLGRIFENLLAEINPETGETARKATGSYYTPRAIVEYMVDESLKEYLKKKTSLAEEKLGDLLSYSESDVELLETEREGVIAALDEVKIIDPACGSGAFPMGMLQKIVLILQKVDPKSERWLEKQVGRIPDALLRKETLKQLKTKSINYIRKLGVLRDCIYGVDIQETATEISKLRFFLSLIIDEAVDDTTENRGIEPLPNLEFKFVCANTLVPLPDKSTPALYEDEAPIKKLKSLREQYFRSSGKEKITLREKFLQEQTKIFNKLLLWHHADTQSFQLSTWKPFENKPSSWFDADWMFGIKTGFDIVIANPPYVDSENMTVQNEEQRKFYHGVYSCAKGNWDLFVIFAEAGMSLLNSAGSLTYIVPNKLISASYSEELRKLFLSKSIFSIRNCSHIGVFEEVNVYPIIVHVGNFPSDRDVAVSAMADMDSLKFSRIVPHKIFYKDIYWDMFLCDDERYVNVVEKLLVAGDTSKAYGKVSGAATVAEAYKFADCVEEYSPGATAHKKLINSGTIDRYLSLWGAKDTRYIKHAYHKPIVKNTDIKAISENRYRQASTPKIIIAGMTKDLECFYDANGDYLPGKSTIIILEETEFKLKYVLALLNSKLLRFFVRNYFSSLAMQGGCFSLNPEQFLKIPVIHISMAEQSKCVVIVDRILSSKVPSEAVDKYLKQIDTMVYEAYGLARNEVELVEQSSLE